MKKYILALIALLALNSCNDDFLEKYPIESQTEATAFKTYDNFKTFAWGFYDELTNSTDYGRGLHNTQTNFRSDMWAGYVSTYATSEPNPYRAGTLTTPADGNGWNFAFVRRTNLMLTNIDGSNMSQAEKDHWRSVAYFFRAYAYSELIARFGDVPWIETVLKETDTDIIYGARDPRKEVADKVLENLQFAEQNIKPKGDGENTINKHVVQALMSRFCLFEGTWRKYHNLGDADKYINECIRVSKALMEAYPDVAISYDALLNSESLKSYPGIILYKEYIPSILTHNTSHYERTSSGIYEMPKYTIETYLCKNGKPIFHPEQDQYDGDTDMYDEFRNRDYRLLMTVVPPYCMDRKVIGGLNPPSFEFPSNDTWNNAGYYLKEGTNLMEYAELLEQILPNKTSKRLPVFNWSGSMNWISPNINGPGQAPMASRSGYYLWRSYNLWETNSNMGALNHGDKPLFWIEEILLNYAEAMFEKGSFTQDIANETINKLRPRAGVANMIISEINSSFDPKRDQSVDPVLWEIRRERLVELVGAGFGFYDIRRWKKGEWYINRPQVGTYIKKTDYGYFDKGALVREPKAAWKNLTLVNKDFSPATNEGYLKRFDNPVNLGYGWNDKYYLYAIPKNQIILNPNIEQNPGWD